MILAEPNTYSSQELAQVVPTADGSVTTQPIHFSQIVTLVQEPEASIAQLATEVSQQD